MNRFWVLALAVLSCEKKESGTPTIVIPSPTQTQVQPQPQPQPQAQPQPKEIAMPLEIRSTAFANATTIPKKYTADGSDWSPPLAWKNPPAGTKAFALVNDDPDAPAGTWDHWIVYDLPATTLDLPEGVGRVAKLPVGAKEGKNSWGRANYGGPSPPPGKPHRYYFKLYALSAATELAAGATKTELEAAMQGKIMGVAQWLGTYGR